MKWRLNRMITEPQQQLHQMLFSPKCSQDKRFYINESKKNKVFSLNVWRRCIIDKSLNAYNQLANCGFLILALLYTTHGDTKSPGTQIQRFATKENTCGTSAWQLRKDKGWKVKMSQRHSIREKAGEEKGGWDFYQIISTLADQYQPPKSARTPPGASAWKH